jgi:hypothetical protein
MVDPSLRHRSRPHLRRILAGKCVDDNAGIRAGVVVTRRMWTRMNWVMVSVRCLAWVLAGSHVTTARRSCPCTTTRLPKTRISPYIIG